MDIKKIIREEADGMDWIRDEEHLPAGIGELIEVKRETSNPTNVLRMEVTLMIGDGDSYPHTVSYFDPSIGEGEWGRIKGKSAYPISKLKIAKKIVDGMGNTHLTRDGWCRDLELNDEECDYGWDMGLIKGNDYWDGSLDELKLSWFDGMGNELEAAFK